LILFKEDVTVNMDKLFPDNPRYAYKTERFCTAVDHNIVVSVEICRDGNEYKTCQNVNSCRKKQKCRYLSQEKNVV